MFRRMVSLWDRRGWFTTCTFSFIPAALLCIFINPLYHGFHALPMGRTVFLYPTAYPRKKTVYPGSLDFWARAGYTEGKRGDAR